MPIHFSFVKEHNLMVTSYVGEINDSDLIPSYRRLMRRGGKFFDVCNEIVDMRKASMINLSSDAMRELSIMIDKYLKERSAKFRTAVIAPSDLSYGMSRQYQVFCDQSAEKIMVFRSTEEGLDWLGIKDFSLETVKQKLMCLR